jgi:hypothetical protein
VARLDEAQGHQLVEDGTVVVDRRLVVPVLEAWTDRARPPGPAARPRRCRAGPPRRPAPAPRTRRAEREGPGQGQALGQGVDAAAELDPPQQGPQLGADGGNGGGAHAAPPAAGTDEEPLACLGLSVLKCSASRAKRAGPVAAGTGATAPAASVARSIIRAMRPTLTASASRARAHAASTRSGPQRLTRPNKA